MHLSLAADQGVRSLAKQGFVATAIAVALLWMPGCGAEKPTNDRSTTRLATPAQLTDDDYLKFAKFLEMAAKSGDVAALNGAIDWDAIIVRATTPSEGSTEFNATFMLGTFRDLVGEAGIAATIAKLVKDGGEFRCLRVHSFQGAKRLVFRLLVPQKPALDYFEFELARRADGSVCANDYYVFRTGETISEAVRRNYHWIAPTASRMLAGGEPTQQDIDVADQNRMISEMQACSHAGDGARALDIYARLPATVQNEKTVLLTRLEAANLVHGKEYDDAMRAIRSALPADPCLDFVLVDYFSQHQQYDELRAAIDRLDKRIGGDPYQDARRALSYMQEKKYKLARDYAKKAIKVEDTLVLPYCILLQIALEEKNFDEVSELLTTMEDKSIMTFSDLATTPAYAEFVKSPQYQVWARKAKPK